MPKLTKVQRNDLYMSILAGGLDPADCDLTEIYEPEQTRTVPIYSLFRITQVHSRHELQRPARRITQIKHVSSSSTYHVTITFYQNEHGIGTRPVYFYGRAIEDQRLSGGLYGWQGCLDGAYKWAADVKRKYVDPDYWAQLRRRRDFLAEAQRQDLVNTPFKPEEQAEIANQLQAIKDYVSLTYSLSAEQAERIDRRFGDIHDASRRLGRKDWLLLFGGAMLSLILSAVAPPEAVQHILTMAAQGLGHLFGGEPSRPLPP